MVSKIQIEELEPVANVCNQVLREVWRNESASLAHVIMEPDNVSLLHRHDSFTEVYYVLDGQGTLWLNGKPPEVVVGSVAEILPGVSHKLAKKALRMIQGFGSCWRDIKIKRIFL